MFIKEYTIMNYEKAKYRSRTSQEAQPSSEITQEIRIESGHRTSREGVQDVAATGVPICAGGGEFAEGVRSSRRERGSNCKNTGEYNQRSSVVKQEDQRKYQWDYNRSDKSLSKATWGVRKIKDRWSLSMSLID